MFAMWLRLAMKQKQQIWDVNKCKMFPLDDLGNSQTSCAVHMMFVYSSDQGAAATSAFPSSALFEFSLAISLEFDRPETSRHKTAAFMTA